MLAKKPIIWQTWALLFEQAETRSETIARNIQKHRDGDLNPNEEEEEDD